MKNTFYLTAILALFLSMDLQAQPDNMVLSPATGKYVMENVVEVSDASADELFTKAKEWVSLNYVSANDVIQYAEGDKIILKGAFAIGGLVSYRVDHTLVLMFKDGRFKFTYTDFVCDNTRDGGFRTAFEENKGIGKFTKSVYKRTGEEVDASVATLVKYMETPTLASDW